MAELIVITALLPLTALMLVTQTNPYHALVIRGILGAVAALVYAIFGAADVALTEALVGTMLAITLYAVAVRSSMSFRLGVLERGDESIDFSEELGHASASENSVRVPNKTVPEALAAALRQGLQRYHLRLEPVGYDSEEALKEAIAREEVHAILQPSNLVTTADAQDSPSSATTAQLPQLHIRLPRLHSLLQGELPPELAHLKLYES